MNYLPIPLPTAARPDCKPCGSHGVYDANCRACVVRFVATLPRPTRETYKRAIRERHGPEEARRFVDEVEAVPARKFARGAKPTPPRKEYPRPTDAQSVGPDLSKTAGRDRAIPGEIRTDVAEILDDGMPLDD